MARIAGPGDGAEVGPERPEAPAQDRVGTESSPTPGSSAPGDFSSSEADAVPHVDALEDGVRSDAEAGRSSGTGATSSRSGADAFQGDPLSPEYSPWQPGERPPHRPADEALQGWDWEADATGPDEVVGIAGDDRDAARQLDREGTEASVAGLAASTASPQHEPTLAPSTPPAKRRGRTRSLLLGGALAAAMGFGAAWLAQDRFGSAGLPAGFEERLAALEGGPSPDGAEIEALAGRVADLETRLAALEDVPEPETRGDFDPEPLREELAAGLSQAQERATALEERLAALERRPAAPAVSPLDPGPALRPAPVSGPAASGGALEARVAAAEADLAEAQAALTEAEAALAALDGRVGSNAAGLSALDARLSEAETRLDAAEATGATAVEEARAAAAALEETRTRAEAAEAQARREAAIAALDSALDAGEPFEAALPDLGEDVPEALARAANEGVGSLAALRETFPEAARAGLAAARSEGLVEDGGVLGFLSGQLSVRSTAPREGSDPDAVLSRAEAALAQGRLADALAEIDALPEAVRAAMADWIATARARAEAEAALSSLRQAELTPASAD